MTLFHRKWRANEQPDEVWAVARYPNIGKYPGNQQTSILQGCFELVIFAAGGCWAMFFFWLRCWWKIRFASQQPFYLLHLFIDSCCLGCWPCRNLLVLGSSFVICLLMSKTPFVQRGTSLSDSSFRVSRTRIRGAHQQLFQPRIPGTAPTASAKYPM